MVKTLEMGPMAKLCQKPEGGCSVFDHDLDQFDIEMVEHKRCWVTEIVAQAARTEAAVGIELQQAFRMRAVPGKTKAQVAHKAVESHSTRVQAVHPEAVQR